MLSNHEKQFWIRRTHSLLGVIPLGAFLLQHLAANSLSIFGAQKFNDWVHMLQTMPLVWVLEYGIIFLPMLIHGILGLFYLKTARFNDNKFGYVRNRLYKWQRLTGVIVFAFVIMHVATLHFGSPGFKEDFFTLLKTMFQNPWLVATYMIGTAAAVFHFSNGLATFCITWGLTISDRSQKMMLGVSVLVGLFMMIMTVVSIYGFWVNPTPAMIVSGGF